MHRLLPGLIYLPLVSGNGYPIHVNGSIGAGQRGSRRWRSSYTKDSGCELFIPKFNPNIIFAPNFEILRVFITVSIWNFIINLIKIVFTYALFIYI